MRNITLLCWRDLLGIALRLEILMKILRKIFNENLSPCSPCGPWIFLVAYGKKSLEEIFNKNMAYGQKYIIGI
ncbi:hypothetical protein CIK97_06085 [Prevotella sp. P3-120]|nr:hypothetical protein CIK97_06085 [Prevotella sp. P3-120]OYP52035.1 hypothetical protein CIK93_04225 [Prevotella sp. P3-92]